MYFPWKTIGHETQKKEIEENFLHDNLSHAYLFTGPNHIGKFTFAKEIALAMLCPNNMCRTCAECRQIENLTHPDFIILDLLYIDPISKNWDEISTYSNIPQKHRSTAPTAKTDSISINDIREIQKLLQRKTLGKNKICLIKNIHRMNENANNAFLKIVEEPPENVHFIFTSDQESKLLQTFISRVRKIPFYTLHDKILIQALNDDKNTNEILEYAQGRIGIALKLMNNREELIQYREEYLQIIDIYENMNTLKLFDVANNLSKNVYECKKFFEYSKYYLRSKIDSENKKVIKTLEILEKTEEYIKYNVNKKLALENFFLQIS